MGIAGIIIQHGKITISLGTGNVATLKGALDETGTDTTGIVCATDPLSSDGGRKAKTALTETERKKARQEYLDRRGIPDSFHW